MHIPCAISSAFGADENLGGVSHLTNGIAVLASRYRHLRNGRWFSGRRIEPRVPGWREFGTQRACL